MGGVAFPSFFDMVLLSPVGGVAFSSLLLVGAVLFLILLWSGGAFTSSLF